MKIKSFEQFINEFEIEGEVQGKPLWNGKDYLKNGHIDLSSMELTELPCIFPEKWDNDFYCYDNKLTSLHGCPQHITGNFMCYENELTNLQDGPVEVYGDYNCSYNKLTSLKGAPKRIGNWFDCSNNSNLEDYQNFPQKIFGSLIIQDTKFTKAEVEKVSTVQGTIYSN